jgi:hypothetical protein
MPHGSFSWCMGFACPCQGTGLIRLAVTRWAIDHSEDPTTEMDPGSMVRVMARIVWDIVADTNISIDRHFVHQVLQIEELCVRWYGVLERYEICILFAPRYKELTFTECYCDDALSNATTLQSDSSCNMPCTGSPSEVCGGSGLLTVYYANTPIPQGPHTNSGPAGWTSQGCWADGSTKALTHEVQVKGGADNMTITGCTSACSAAGYKLAGVEYASTSQLCPLLTKIQSLIEYK